MESNYRRRSTRRPDYDYSQTGGYFVTICTHKASRRFGQIAGGKLRLNALGQLVEQEWRRTATVRPTVQVDAFVVMPNHLHGILMISSDNEECRPAIGKALQSNTLGAIISQFKSKVTKESRRLADPPSLPIWQRNYYDHIVRSEASLNRIRKYIIANPSRWGDDEYFVE